MSILQRNNVRTSGSGDRAMIFAHGFGCDQAMWRYVAPAFEDDFVTVLFDNVGAGNSDLTAFSETKYSQLSGYASDIIEIGQALHLKETVFVGHSVSSMIGALASIEAPDLIQTLVMVGPSPRYIDDDGYVGGFNAAQIDEMLEFLDNNHLGWSAAMAPVIMGNADRPALGVELVNSFCRTDPAIAKHFARTTFTSDNRSDLRKIRARSLILQCSDDIIAPDEVGEYLHREIPNSQLVKLRATGHCPNLSAPDEVIAAIRDFV